MTDSKSRFFLARDNDSHWYIVDAFYRTQWEEWLNLDADDEKSWDVPEFASQIDGPHRVIFTDWEIV